MNASKSGFVVGWMAGLLVAGATCQAAPQEKLSGSLVGFVGNSTGIPQMGATVLLFNRYDRLVQKALTNENGLFGFPALTPDIYSIKVTLSSFVPAIKNNITVQPGMRSFLSVNLASVLSSIELVYSAPGQGGIMSDDWKWVLRSSLATRPVLRLFPKSEPPQKSTASAAFSQTRGLVKITGGDTASSAGADSQPDLGTAFALATSVFGSNRLQVAGNFGYASRFGTPTAAFRTSYSRGESAVEGPEVQVTMRQLFLPSRAGAAILGGQQDGAPALRSMSVTLADRRRLNDEIELVWGASLESVSFLQRLNYMSPFARLTYSLGENGVLELGYSNGLPPSEMYAAAGGSPDTDLQDDLAALATFPRVSLRRDRVALQRAENYEIGYHKVAGSRTYALAAYHERISNAALTLSSPQGLLASGDLLPDLFSNSSIFNIGTFRNVGYTASVTQAAGDHLNLTLAYGNGDALRTEYRALASDHPEELRSMIRSSRRNWLAGKVAGTAPVLGTRFVGSYQWTDYRSLTPGHVFRTLRTSPQAGLNFHFRQPLPGPGLIPVRLEATAELRNLLAQGYLPLTTSDGGRIVLVHSPRLVRGGFSFIF